MANCPDCGGAVGEDFGLVDCPQCGAELYIEFEGTVRRREMVVPEAVEADAPVPEFETMAVASATPDEFMDIESQEPSFELSAVEEDALPPTSPPALDNPADEEIELGELPDILLPEEPEARSSADLTDLAQFATADSLSQTPSAYTYHLFLSGIDTKEVRDELRDAMADAKFLWDVEELLRSIKDGELEIKNITPVKASVLLNRIHHLPIQVKWVQHAAVQK